MPQRKINLEKLKLLSFEEILRLFNHIPDIIQGSLHLLDKSKRFPPIDVYETQYTVFVESELPGINPSNISVYVRGNELSIEGSKTDDFAPPAEVTEGVKFLCMERSFGTFKRIIKLPVPCDTKETRASYKKGVLIIQLKKIVDRRGNKTEIKID
ncbi:MAG: Heat shock protein Hsp20 [Parcubacteria group bacterium GW2011_GWC2_38_7]|nr:MAG: Heat shock protein Hsp20 [Parcubacteria group bacterium GW2011_GWC2_38_7]